MKQRVINNFRQAMNNKRLKKPLLFFVFYFLFSVVQAQDSKSQYHPINHAVISQTIAPDARAAGL